MHEPNKIKVRFTDERIFESYKETRSVSHQENTQMNQVQHGMSKQNGRHWSSENIEEAPKCEEIVFCGSA